MSTTSAVAGQEQIGLEQGFIRNTGRHSLPYAGRVRHRGSDVGRALPAVSIFLCSGCRGAWRAPYPAINRSSIRHNLQQITVGVEEIQAVVITPVDRPVGRNALGTKSI